MDVRPRHLAAAGALAAAGFLGIGALTAASADDNGSNGSNGGATTSTTVGEQGTNSGDHAKANDGNCPHDGDRGSASGDQSSEGSSSS